MNISRFIPKAIVPIIAMATLGSCTSEADKKTEEHRKMLTENLEFTQPDSLHYIYAQYKADLKLSVDPNDPDNVLITGTAHDGIEEKTVKSKMDNIASFNDFQKKLGEQLNKNLTKERKSMDKKKVKKLYDKLFPLLAEQENKDISSGIEYDEETQTVSYIVNIGNSNMMISLQKDPSNSKNVVASFNHGTGIDFHNDGSNTEIISTEDFKRVLEEKIGWLAKKDTEIKIPGEGREHYEKSIQGAVAKSEAAFEKLEKETKR